jgi:hypothetical protein
MKSMFKIVAIVALTMAACLPYAVAASAWSGDSAGGVLLWLAIGAVYGGCVGAVFFRYAERVLS